MPARLPFRLPFVGRIFWAVLAVVVVLVVLAFGYFLVFTDYELATRDIVGSLISLLIFSYLVHLWLLPGEYAEADDEAFPDDEAPPDEKAPPDRKAAPDEV